ncbi:hypothetical protein GTW20_25605 [Nocardiopsis alba]|uniref:Uncharacterized protein n=1 Tax=Nocardiopsis alba TaxID=53437 RepID=A0A7K2J0I5_9ACTN|nr:hypothetical protein [Nocardiopsis alba]
MTWPGARRWATLEPSIVFGRRSSVNHHRSPVIVEFPRASEPGTLHTPFTSCPVGPEGPGFHAITGLDAEIDRVDPSPVEDAFEASPRGFAHWASLPRRPYRFPAAGRLTTPVPEVRVGEAA